MCLDFSVVSIYAEDCPTGNVQQECTHLTCSGDYTLVCVNDVCTCNPTQNNNCTTLADCTGNANLPNCPPGWHCVDNACRCGGNWGK
ncbi:serine protease inhibitor Cvsi-2-like isoform X2 [Mercenaria mercenaria]|uniref:serine protease inhibitor Cvsi-2-like isoform X2 n=1 Tax=Mercenaria mercenaria TaxID=6596 RepID=UPI00234E4B36|nr:serine protease inhibitor Cvsi-2-like isoform X2 [Mercenaria mercenaria]